MASKIINAEPLRSRVHKWIIERERDLNKTMWDSGFIHAMRRVESYIDKMPEYTGEDPKEGDHE